MQIPRFHLPIRGRDDLLHSLLERTRTPGVTTLWGPGGMGKTRLAVEVFDRARRRGQRTIFGSVYDDARPEGLFRQLTRVADVSRGFQLGAPAAERLVRWLGDGALLVVDEAELALDAVREVVAAVHSFESVHVLVTSREGLGLPTEAPVRLEPLGVEDAARVLVAAAPRGTADLDGARRVCARLEGLPLAVTLAAGRLEVLSLAELEQRLEDPLPMLRNPSVVGRHSALGASIAASRDGLPNWARRQLAELPVFASHFSMRAAERVVTPDPDGALVMDGLQLLARRSLLRVLDGPDGPRFQLAPFVREAVLAEAPVSDAVVDRWLEWVGSTGIAALRSRHTGASDGAWLDLQEADIVKALSLALATPDRNPVALSRLGAARMSTPIALEEREALGRALEVVDAGRADPLALAKIEEARASLDARQGDLEASIRRLERALDLARQAEDAEVEAALLGILGNRRDNLGDGEAALELFRASLACAEAVQNPDLMARAAVALSITEDWENSWNPERSLARFEALIPNQRGVCRLDLLRRSAQLHWSLGRSDAALAHLAEADPDSPSPELWQSIEPLTLRGYIQLASGDEAGAEQSFDLAFERATWAGFKKLQGIAALARGQLLFRQSAFDAVEAHLAPWVETLTDGRPDWLEAALVAEAVRALALARRGRAAEVPSRLDSAARIAGSGSIEPVYPALLAVLPGMVASATRLADLEAGRDVGPTSAGAGLQDYDPRYATSLRELCLMAQSIEAALEQLQAAWVSYGATGFAPPGSPFVDLRRSRSSSRIFARLSELRLKEPGAVLSMQSLIEAGWPGESVLPAAAKNRLHVALASLRKKGLDAVLEHVEGGYRLDPEVVFRAGTRE